MCSSDLDHWASFQLSPTWKVPGRDICWLETLAIELLTYFLEQMGLQHYRLLIHSDNQGTIEIVYIESIANPADPISRGEPGVAGKQIFPSFKLPEELSHCFLHV